MGQRWREWSCVKCSRACMQMVWKTWPQESMARGLGTWWPQARGLGTWWAQARGLGTWCELARGLGTWWALVGGVCSGARHTAQSVVAAFSQAFVVMVTQSTSRCCILRSRSLEGGGGEGGGGEWERQWTSMYKHPITQNA